MGLVSLLCLLPWSVFLNHWLSNQTIRWFFILFLPFKFLSTWSYEFDDCPSPLWAKGLLKTDYELLKYLWIYPPFRLVLGCGGHESFSGTRSDSHHCIDMIASPHSHTQALPFGHLLKDTDIKQRGALTRPKTERNITWKWPCPGSSVLTLVPSPPLLYTVGTPKMRTHSLAEEAKDNHANYCLALNLKRPELALWTCTQSRGHESGLFSLLWLPPPHPRIHMSHTNLSDHHSLCDNVWQSQDALWFPNLCFWPRTHEALCQKKWHLLCPDSISKI